MIFGDLVISYNIFIIEILVEQTYFVFGALENEKIFSSYKVTYQLGEFVWRPRFLDTKVSELNLFVQPSIFNNKGFVWPMATIDYIFFIWKCLVTFKLSREIVYVTKLRIVPRTSDFVLYCQRCHLTIVGPILCK